MRLTYFFVLCLFLVACENVDLKLEKKTEAWSKVVLAEMPVGSEKAKILEWGTNNGFEFISGQKGIELVTVIGNNRGPRFCMF